jgi:hypothetical protein
MFVTLKPLSHEDVDVLVCINATVPRSLVKRGNRGDKFVQKFWKR